MNEWVYCYDSSGALINDPSRSLEYAEDIQCASQWPKGYGPASFRVKRNIAAQWAIKQAQRLRIKDGHTTIYEGRLEDLDRSLSTNDQSITLTATGYYAVLKERLLRKRWIDNEPVSRMTWPAGRYGIVAQHQMDVTKQDDLVLLRAGYGDYTHTAGDGFYLQYSVPIGSLIRRIDSTYTIRTGEGITIQWFNSDQSAVEISITDSSGAQVSGGLDILLAAGDTDAIQLRFLLVATDIYDENDYAKLHDIIIKCHYDSAHPNFASPTYTTGQIIKDVLILVGKTDLSTDYSLITDPALALTTFTTMSDEAESGDSIIERLCAYGDASFNTYGLAVWDSDHSSDGKPQVSLTARSTASPKWQASLHELESFQDSLSLDELWNWIHVVYTDNRGQRLYLTPDDDALLKDTTSITTYGERHSPVIDIGKGTEALALSIGQRYLAYHKDPLRRSELALKKWVRDAQGNEWPVNRIRAGDSLLLTDYEGGITYFWRGVNYSAKSGVVRLTPDQPPNTLSAYLVQRERGMVR